MKKLKEKVRAILRDNPTTRDSDALLTIELWKQNYYLEMHFTKSQIEKLLEIMRYAPESMIGRYRQQIQYDEGAYPASPKVEAQRKKNSKQAQEDLGYGVKAPEVRKQANILDRLYDKTVN